MQCSAVNPTSHLQAAGGLEGVHEGAQAAHVHLAGAGHVQDGINQVVVCVRRRREGGGVSACVGGEGQCLAGLPLLAVP